MNIRILLFVNALKNCKTNYSISIAFRMFSCNYISFLGSKIDIIGKKLCVNR